MLGEVDQGSAVLDGVLNIGRAVVASEMLGVGDEAFSRTAQYLKERKQFGKLIGEFQALQHRISHLYVDLEITRAAVLKALQTLDEDFDNAAPIVAVAKARAGTIRHARRAGRPADARRHRHDRPVRHRPVHEAHARRARSCSAMRISTPTGWRS